MLQEFIENKHYVFHDSFDSWQEAVIASCQPLIDDKTIEPPYIQAIIDCIDKYGPYIVIAPDIAMPHATENAEGVNDTAISFMKVETPVVFDPEDSDKNARLFFVLASINSEKHLENMTKLSEMLMNDLLVEDLLKVKNLEELQEVANKHK